MNRLNRLSPWLLALAFSLVAGVSTATFATTATTTAPASRVHVEYVNPQNFSENRYNGAHDRYNDLHYLKSLKAYIIKRAAPLLTDDQSLYITVTDINLAGSYEPRDGRQLRHVRVMNAHYPPRINLSFKWVDGNGKVLGEGTRKLSNLAYLNHILTAAAAADPLHYDKAQLRRWIGRDLSKL